MDWASVMGQDNNNKQTWVESEAVITKTIPAPLTVALLSEPGCKSLSVSFSLSSHTFRDTGSENVPMWVLVQGNSWIRETGLKKFRSSWRKLSKEMVVLGLGSEQNDLILCSCLIRITLCLKSRSWLRWTPKAYFPCSKKNPSSSPRPSKPVVSHPIYLIHHRHSHSSKALYSRLP